MTREPVTIIGSYLSPYVRKVLVFLEIKRINYVIDPVEPFYGNDEFSRSSMVPVLIDASLTITDSTIICEYLEEHYPEHALYPSTPQFRARARWLEEYADTRMGEVFIGRMYNERVIKRFVSGEQADEAIVAKAIHVEAPQILDYLEREYAKASPFLDGELGLADIAIASFLRNAHFAGFSVDGEQWPKMHALAQHAFQHPAFAVLQPFEELLLRTPPDQHRDALIAAGAPVSSQSQAEEFPRRDVFAT